MDNAEVIGRALKWEADGADLFHGMLGGYHLSTIEIHECIDATPVYCFQDIADYKSGGAEFDTLDDAKAEGERRLADALDAAGLEIREKGPGTTIKNMHSILSEGQETLGAEFEAVWDENVESLYEP